MQKWGKILLCVAFSFMFTFLAVGYAQLTDSLSISGEVTTAEIQAVYITSISASANRFTGSLSVSRTGTLIFQNGDYNLNAQSSGTGGSVTYTITVKNNSGIDQYLGYLTATTDAGIKKLNNNCKITYQQSGEDRLVKQGEEKTFTITVQNTTRNSVSMKDVEGLLVFSPNFTNDDTMNATNALAKMFANVLAGKGPNGDGTGITYQGKQIAANKIMEEITKKMTDVDTGGYTGNVGNATHIKRIFEQISTERRFNNIQIAGTIIKCFTIAS